MFTYQKKRALITGASSGIGEAFARKLASLGSDLLLVARSEKILCSLAQELEACYHVHCDVLCVDLSQPENVASIKRTVQERGLHINLLINNAGFGMYGPFETLASQQAYEDIAVNVTALVSLTYAFLPEMLERGEGAIINVASMAGFLPLPYMAVYGGTKAFVLSFSQALWAEYRERGLRILALCPGPVQTNFFRVASSEPAPVPGEHVSPERVVVVALRALDRDKSYVVPGPINAFLMLWIRLIPRSTLARLIGWLMRPRKKPSSRVWEDNLL